MTYNSSPYKIHRYSASRLTLPLRISFGALAVRDAPTMLPLTASCVSLILSLIHEPYITLVEKRRLLYSSLRLRRIAHCNSAPFHIRTMHSLLSSSEALYVACYGLLHTETLMTLAARPSKIKESVLLFIDIYIHTSIYEASIDRMT